MNEASVTALVAAIASLITAVGIWVNRKVMADVARGQIQQTEAMTEYHLQINSRMDQFLASVRAEAELAGRIEGMIAGRAAGRAEGLELGGAQYAAQQVTSEQEQQRKPHGSL